MEMALEDLESKLQRRDLKFTLDDAQLKDFARSKARACGETSARIKDTTQALKAIDKLLARYSQIARPIKAVLSVPKMKPSGGDLSEKSRNGYWTT